MITQKDKLLEALQKAGAAGVSNFDLNAICFRYGARLLELRQDGYDIKSVKGKKGSGRRFILVPKPSQMSLLEVAA